MAYPSKSLNRFPEEETKQGIVAVLGEERSRNAASSIRRTLSADMSSRIWREENGFFFSQVRRAGAANFWASDYSSSSSSSSESEEEWDRHRAPSPDHRKKESGAWILVTEKKETDYAYALPPPYALRNGVMSDRSLEICTESLGSESGSDCCISCSRFFCRDEEKDSQFAKYKKKTKTKQPPLPPPPPLPSISGGNGTTLQMQSRRENGRLVLSAVQQPSRNKFLAERREGRLVLSLARPAPPQNAENDQNIHPAAMDLSKNPNLLPTGMVDVHKLAVKRLVAISNTNPKTATETEMNNNNNHIRVAALLIPPPLNAYESFWKRKTAAVPASPMLKRTKNLHENQEMVVKKGCKETRRSILFWEPYCISTS